MAELKFHVEGIDPDEGDVRLNAFIGQLKSLQQALNAADEIVSKSDAPTSYYRITGLKHESPAEITLTAYPKNKRQNHTSLVLDYFVSGVEHIRNGDMVEGITDKFLESVMSLVNGIGKKYQRMWVEIDSGDGASLDKSLVAGIEKLLSKTTVSYGSVKGIVETFNAHSEPHFFNLYDTYTGKAVKCVFAKSLLSKAVEAVEKNVTVYGLLKIRDKQYHPSECVVKNIEVHGSDDELPGLSELFGVAPDATGEESTFDFIRKIRDEWHH